MISARAKGVSTVPVSPMVPGVQDPDDPDRLDHLPGAHRNPAAPVQHGASRRQNSEYLPRSARTGPGLAVAAELSMGVDARPEGSPASLSHATKGELCREQALGFWRSVPSDTPGQKINSILRSISDSSVSAPYCTPAALLPSVPCCQRIPGRARSSGRAWT